MFANLCTASTFKFRKISPNVMKVSSTFFANFMISGLNLSVVVSILQNSRAMGHRSTEGVAGELVISAKKSVLL